MQIISTSSYNDINITEPVDGMNNLTTNLLVENKTFNGTITSQWNGVIHEHDYSTNNTAYIFNIKLKIDKDMNSNIFYYEILETYSANDPETFMSANQLSSIDDIELTFMNRNINTNYNIVRLILRAFDVNGNPIYGPKVTGEIYCYSLLFIVITK